MLTTVNKLIEVKCYSTFILYIKCSKEVPTYQSEFFRSYTGEN